MNVRLGPRLPRLSAVHVAWPEAKYQSLGAKRHAVGCRTCLSFNLGKSVLLVCQSGFLIVSDLERGNRLGRLGGLRAFAVAVLLTQFLSWIGERVMLEAGPAVNLTIAISLFVFVGFIARLVYEETGQLYGLRKIAKDTEARLKREEYFGRYVSPKLVSVIRSKPRAPAQRRRLTIYFNCLVSALMDRMPEHKMTEVLNEYLDAMAEIALDHGGTVDKFMGDGLMVFFGDPESTGARGDAEACLDMALAMTARLEHLYHDWSMKGLRAISKCV